MAVEASSGWVSHAATTEKKAKKMAGKTKEHGMSLAVYTASPFPVIITRLFP